MLLLSDGSVLCRDAGASANGTANWRVLGPGADGSYVNRSWVGVAARLNSPHFFASAVFAGGRVFVVEAKSLNRRHPIGPCCSASSMNPTWEHEITFTPSGHTITDRAR
jgi:hypothetical protein